MLTSVAVRKCIFGFVAADDLVSGLLTWLFSVGRTGLVEARAFGGKEVTGAVVSFGFWSVRRRSDSDVRWKAAKRLRPDHGQLIVVEDVDSTADDQGVVVVLDVRHHVVA